MLFDVSNNLYRGCIFSLMSGTDCRYDVEYDFDDGGVAALANSLVGLPRCATIPIRGCVFKHHLVETIIWFEILSLRVLDLSNNGMHKAGMQVLERALQPQVHPSLIVNIY